VSSMSCYSSDEDAHPPASASTQQDPFAAGFQDAAEVSSQGCC